MSSFYYVSISYIWFHLSLQLTINDIAPTLYTVVIDINAIPVGVIYVLMI